MPVPTDTQLVDYFIFDAEDVDVGNFSRAKTNEVAAHFKINPQVAFRILDALADRGVLHKTRDVMKRHRGKTAFGYQWWEYGWKPADLARWNERNQVGERVEDARGYVREDADVWYHGSPHRFEKFRSRVGKTFGTDASDVPLFLTRDPKFASLYAGPNGYIYEVRPHVEQTFDARSFVRDEQYWPPPRDALSPEGQTLYDDLVENRIFPELIRYGTKQEDEDKWRSMHDSQGTYASIFARNYDVMETTEMKRWLLAHDYDSFFVSGDGPDDNLAIFNPEQIEILSKPEPSNEVGERATHARGYVREDDLPDAALCIVIDDSGCVLTVSRPEPPHELAIPGGIVDPGESPAEAAVRELGEECGITAHSVAQVATVRSPTDGRRVHVFRARSHTYRAYAAEPHTQVAWLSPEELLAQARLYRSTVRELMDAGLLSPAVDLHEVREPELSYLLGPKGAIRAIGHEDGPDPPRDGIARYRSPEGSYRYVYYVRGEPVSALQVMTRDKKHARVANVWTVPHARRHGYASKLLQQARRDFRTVEHSDDRSADAVAWIDRVGESYVLESHGADWQDALVPGDARYVPATVVPQMPDIVARALAADAPPPLEYMGAGMTGVVFCAGDVAYKVARATEPISHLMFEEEAEWLADASEVPEVAPHVARYRDFDPDNLVIVRDCPKVDPEQSAWRYGEGKLHDLHRQIERDMIPHGWTAPEFKPDSYVLTTRGPVLVDASMPSRVGQELARYIEQVVAGERTLWTTRPEDLAFAVRMEAGRTLTQAESDRLETLIQSRWPPHPEMADSRGRRGRELIGSTKRYGRS